MKYMLLMQATALDMAAGPASWAREDVVAHVEFMRELMENYFKPGELLDAQGLAAPDTVRVIQAGDDGEPIVTDGPFPESKEFLAGYWLLELADEKRAVEIGAHISAAPGPGGKPLNFPIVLHPIGQAPA
ncbi:YciI family protein [Phytomonospora sp. NPDC050363]|uniref:YciI family protein n=1 Tax=Phytomonospora sp. NPDC050363 TaxID=3155642 RepID=UPI0033FDF445